MPDLTLADALNLAVSHHRAGRLGDAEAVYRQILARFPDQPDALHLLGVACHLQGRGEEGVRLIRRAIERNPNAAPFHSNLANMLRDRGRRDEAIDAYRAAVRLAPDNRDAHDNLGTLLCAAGRLEEGVAALARANAIAPRAHTCANLGVALQSLGRLDEALAAFEACVSIDPRDAEGHAAVGLVRWLKGDAAGAIAAYRTLADLMPSSAEPYCHLGNLLGQTYALDESIRASRRAIELDPWSAAAWANLATALTRQGRIGEAIAAARESLRAPFPPAAAHDTLLLALNYDENASPRDVFDEHVRWGERYGNPASACANHANDRSPDRRLRIGYVSPDFREHPVATFIGPILARHDRGAFDVYCYSHDSHPDDVTRRLRSCDVAWRSIERLSDDDVAARVREDRIDVLVDLAGHTGNSRLLVLARRPAPVQATYLGYPNTSGLRGVGYRITDAITDPPGESDALNVERLVRLPRTVWVYSPEPAAPDVNDLPARGTGRITFASFNALAKINPATIELWSNLLERVPRARLMLKTVAFLDPPTRERLAEAFAHHGIGGERLVLLPATPDVASHLRAYHDVDVALDPHPYNGTTTTCEAMWMGVPVVTMAGATHASRVGTSLLSSVGLPELIATSPDDWLGIATELAGDHGRLAALRRDLREQMRRSPLTDGPGFTRELESAYRAMWKQWCAA